jgi:hypothetical protein
VLLGFAVVLWSLEELCDELFTSEPVLLDGAALPCASGCCVPCAGVLGEDGFALGLL